MVWKKGSNQHYAKKSCRNRIIHREDSEIKWNHHSSCHKGRWNFLHVSVRKNWIFSTLDRYGLTRKSKIFDRFGDGQKNLVFSTSIYFSVIIICSPVFQNIEFRSTTAIFIFQWHFDFRQVEPRFWTILTPVF